MLLFDIDIDVGTIFAQRLRQVRNERHLTIQEMSEIVVLPKSSLESYLRAKDPKKPGVEALVSISNGMGVSTDWLVGLSETPALDADGRWQWPSMTSHNGRFVQSGVA